jgi:hypothetical protein
LAVAGVLTTVYRRQLSNNTATRDDDVLSRRRACLSTLAQSGDASYSSQVRSTNVTDIDTCPASPTAILARHKSLGSERYAAIVNSIKTRIAQIRCAASALRLDGAEQLHDGCWFAQQYHSKSSRLGKPDRRQDTTSRLSVCGAENGASGLRVIVQCLPVVPYFVGMIARLRVIFTSSTKKGCLEANLLGSN